MEAAGAQGKAGYDYYVVLDFEACWAAEGPRVPEIIEFPRYQSINQSIINQSICSLRVPLKEKDSTAHYTPRHYTLHKLRNSNNLTRYHISHYTTSTPLTTPPRYTTHNTTPYHTALYDTTRNTTPHCPPHYTTRSSASHFRCTLIFAIY